MAEFFNRRLLLFNLIAPLIWSMAIILDFMQYEGFDFTIVDMIPIYTITLIFTFACYSPLWFFPKWRNSKLVMTGKLTIQKAFYFLLVLTSLIYGLYSENLFDFTIYISIYGMIGFICLPKTI